MQLLLEGPWRPETTTFINADDLWVIACDQVVPGMRVHKRYNPRGPCFGVGIVVAVDRFAAAHVLWAIPATRISLKKISVHHAHDRREWCDKFVNPELLQRGFAERDT